MPTMITRVKTFFGGQLVDTDVLGNRYYQERRTPKTGRRRRWVVYAGEDEASRVPAAWHGWLHYTVDEPPSEDDMPYGWQKEHLPNMTGTAEAYRPPGHTLEGGRRDRATGDYEPWTPN
ncbi:MAG: NADH:ubiquinone oxidoreductase subunit NDUFA12 [Proteobacteria bacterium]|nr:NADH:ubiquinone oxidoreductase subunit NDUFA12 [Pseudomonadota bacterium]